MFYASAAHHVSDIFKTFPFIQQCEFFLITVNSQGRSVHQLVEFLLGYVCNIFMRVSTGERAAVYNK